MSTTVSYRGYDGSIIHDAEDELYYGKLLGLRDCVTYHGATPEEAEKIFREAVDDYILNFEMRGAIPPIPFASMPPHLSHDLRVKAALFAHEHHIDMDNVFSMALADFLAKAA